MRATIHIISCIACIFLFCTCQSQIQTNIHEAIDIVADSLSLNNNVYTPNRIFIVDDKAIIYERKGEKLFSVYKFPSFEYLYSFGEKGHGHNELLEIDNSFSTHKGGFYLFEIETNIIKKVTLNEDNAYIEVSDVIKSNRIGLNRFVFLNNKEFVYLSDNDAYEYCLYSNGVEKYFGEYPNHLLPYNNDEPKMFAFNKYTSGKPDGKKFVAFYAYIRMCRIYDNSGNLLRETLLSYPSNKDDTHKIVEYPIPPYVTDKNIYILHNSKGRNELEVWNWDGELVSLYCLDRRLKAFFASGDTLYGLGMDSSDVVYRYQLQEKNM